MSEKFGQAIEARIQDKISNTDIPAVVMGKISKSGEMFFSSDGPSRWDRDGNIKYYPSKHF